MKWILVLALLFWAAPAAPLDFTAPYHGAQAILQGENPYSESITERNQLQIYGRLAEPGEDEHRVAYPVTSLLLLTPFTLLGIENAALLYRVVAAFLMIYGVYRIQNSLLWAILGVILLREPIVAFNVGQMALLSSAMMTLGFGLLRRRRELPASLCFFIASISPTVAIPVTLLVLIPHRRAFAAYSATMSGLFAISLVVNGWWVGGWVDTIKVYPSYTHYGVWVPALIPFGLLFLVHNWRHETIHQRCATGQVLMTVPLTGLYQLSIMAALLSRWQLVICGLILWIAPFTALRFQLPLLIVVHLIDLPYLQKVWSTGFSAIHRAGLPASERGSAAPATSTSAAAPTPQAGSAVQVRSTE